MVVLLPEKIYHQLRAKLLTGDLLPGTHLDYTKLSSEMGVSTTPLREAMNKLASEGLVALVPRAGAIVRKFGVQETVYLYGVREAIETYAGAKAAEKISEAQLQHLGGQLEKMQQLTTRLLASGNLLMTGESLSEFLQADFAFHMIIIETAGNPHLTKLAGDGHIRSRIFGVERFGHSRDLLAETNQIHLAIFESLKKRDASLVSKLVAQHIQRSLELTLAQANPGQHDSWWQSKPAQTMSNATSAATC